LCVTSNRDLNPLTLVTPKNLGIWSTNPPYRWGFDSVIPRYAYHKPFMVKFTDKCERQNRFNLNSTGHLVWYTDGPRPIKALVQWRIGAAQRGGIAPTLCSTPQYSRLKYMVLRHL